MLTKLARRLWRLLPAPLRWAFAPVLISTAVLADVLHLALTALGMPAAHSTRRYAAAALASATMLFAWLALARAVSEHDADDGSGHGEQPEPLLDAHVVLHRTLFSAIHAGIVALGALAAAWAVTVSVIVEIIATSMLRRPVLVATLCITGWLFSQSAPEHEE